MSTLKDWDTKGSWKRTEIKSSKVSFTLFFILPFLGGQVKS